MKTVKRISAREFFNRFDWYAADRYNSASAVLAMLRKRGYNDAECEAIICSKLMRWAADAKTSSSDRASAKDLERWMDHPRNKNLVTPKAVAELVAAHFIDHIVCAPCPNCREPRADYLQWGVDIFGNVTVGISYRRTSTSPSDLLTRSTR